MKKTEKVTLSNESFLKEARKLVKEQQLYSKNKFFYSAQELAKVLHIQKDHAYILLNQGLIEGRKFRGCDTCEGTWKVPNRAIQDFQEKLADPIFPANFPLEKRDSINKIFSKY